MVHGSIDYDLEHLRRCHRVFFWSFCIIFCSFHNIIIHPEPFFAKKFGFFLLLCHRLGKQKQLLASGVANGVSINVRKLSIKTQVVCDYAIGPTLVHKNMAAIPLQIHESLPWGRAVFGATAPYAATIFTVEII